MPGILIIAYLFLGGLGAGALAVSCLLDLLVVRTSFGPACRTAAAERGPAERLVARGLLGGTVALVLGALCLVFDLGRADRILLLLTNPRPSLVTLGAYGLGLLIACGAFLAFAFACYAPRIGRRAAVAVELASLVAALFVMAYTGLLLQQMGAVALWDTAALPVLFVLSSLSCGIALVLAGLPFIGGEDFRVRRASRVLAGADAAIIVFEAVAACLFVATAQGRGASAAQLLAGDLAGCWWVGFVLCGIVIPVAVEVACLVRRRTASAAPALAVVAVLIVVGGFCMRFGVVQAGEHRAPSLAAAPVAGMSG